MEQQTYLGGHSECHEQTWIEYNLFLIDNSANQVLCWSKWLFLKKKIETYWIIDCSIRLSFKFYFINSLRHIRSTCYLKEKIHKPKCIGLSFLQMQPSWEMFSLFVRFSMAISAQSLQLPLLLQDELNKNIPPSF